MIQRNELELTQEKLLAETPALSPEKEVEYRNAFAELEEKFRIVEEKLAAQTEENSCLKQENELLKKALYGQKSEKTKVICEEPEQITFFDEAEQEAEISAKNAEKEIEIAAHKRKPKRTHEEMLSELPVEEVVHEAEEKNCPGYWLV